MIRPTLAASIDTLEQLAALIKQHGELMISEKKDGVRGIKASGKMWSREGKPIPNIHLQKAFCDIPEGLDGEIMFIIDQEEIPHHPPLEHINSIVSSGKLWPKRWTPMFYAFDDQTMANQSYWARYMEMVARWAENTNRPYKIITQLNVYTMLQVMDKFNKVVKRGGEGICLRNPNAKYKQGRSTLNDGCLMRFKKLMREKATIYGYTLLERHIGEQERNAFGLAKRGNKKADLEEQEEIGALLGIHETLGKFKVGSGFTADQRRKYYLKRESLIGKEFWFEYRDKTHKGLPRNATFQGLI